MRKEKRKMKLSQYCHYVGRMKHPLQNDVDNPSMFVAMDSAKKEMDLILLTPGTFLHAYNFVTHVKPKRVYIFAPSLRPEFISDVFNLYMLLKNIMPNVSWVYPEAYDHLDFSMGQKRSSSHINEFDNRLTVSYIPNDIVENVYDIVVRSKDGAHYFSFCLTNSKLMSLYKSKKCSCIHIPKSSTIYGGLTYDQIKNMNQKYLKKIDVHDFTSLEELYNYKKRPIPDYEDLNRYEDNSEDDIWSSNIEERSEEDDPL